MSKAFYGYKVGTKVHDTWYGNGIVVARTKRRLTIRLYSKGVTWAYDAQHVKHFIRKGRKLVV